LRKLLLTAMLGVVLMSVTGTTAQATVLRLPHKPFTSMTRQEKIHYLKRQKWHDNSLIRWYRHHGQLASMGGAHNYQWAKQSLRIVTRNLQRLTRPTLSSSVSGSVIHNLLCIHRYEGAWNDPNAPYWGGLQMDLTFQQTYGNYYLQHMGTADHWPPSIQLQVAAKAVASRGYSPWPNTARLCGLY
jgi:hypothetical protein